MVQLWSSSSDFFSLEFLSTTAGYKAGEVDDKCGLSNLSSSLCFLLFSSSVSNNLFSLSYFLMSFCYFFPFFSSRSAQCCLPVGLAPSLLLSKHLPGEFFPLSVFE